MPVKDGKVESKVQRNKEQNMNESNNMADVDEQFQITIITTKDVPPWIRITKYLQTPYSNFTSGNLGCVIRNAG